MNPQTDNVTENHSTNIKIYYLTNSGRRAQINATTGSYQFDAFYSRHRQQTQQYPKDRCGRRSEQTTGSSKRRKEKDSFQFHFCMLMLPFKRMRVYDNHPIYHMRVSKKGNTSQIYNPQNHLAADNKTTCLIFPLKQKTKRLKKRSKQHTKSVIQMLFKSHLNNTFYI